MTTTPPRRPLVGAGGPFVPVVAVLLGLLGLVGAGFCGFWAWFGVYGLAGSTVGLHDANDWTFFLVMLVGAALGVALGPAIMVLHRRQRGWLIAAGALAALVLVVGLVTGLTAR